MEDWGQSLFDWQLGEHLPQIGLSPLIICGLSSNWGAETDTAKMMMVEQLTLSYAERRRPSLSTVCGWNQIRVAMRGAAAKDIPSNLRSYNHQCFVCFPIRLDQDQFLCKQAGDGLNSDVAPSYVTNPNLQLHESICRTMLVNAPPPQQKQK